MKGVNPAAICNVRLGKGYATAIDVVLELPNRSEILAGGDRQSAFANDARVTFRVLRNGWFLQPRQVERLKRPGCADCLINRPCHVRVYHQRESLPEMSPHGFDTFDVLRQPLAADLHLDGAESLGEIILGLPQ